MPRPGASYSRSLQVEAVRRILVERIPRAHVARELSVSNSVLGNWLKRPDLVAEAKGAEPEPDVTGGGSEKGEAAPSPGEALFNAFYKFLMSLPAIGEVPPDSPPPEVVEGLASAYALSDNTDRIDDLMGWGRGVVDRWFEQADAGEPESMVRQLVFRRARAIMDYYLLGEQTLAASPTARLRMLQARSPAEWQAAPAVVNSAVGMVVDAVEAELKRRGL